MIQILKESLDIQINHPVLTPARLPRRPHSSQSRFARTTSVRIRVEVWSDQWLEVHLHHRLRDAVGHRWDAQRPPPPVPFRDKLDGFGHAIDFVHRGQAATYLGPAVLAHQLQTVAPGDLQHLGG